jgi:ABC-type ATPase with predicted acetyltransferase domain
MLALLQNRKLLEEMSRRCATVGRERPWRVVAEEVISHAERAAAKTEAWRRGEILEFLPESVRRIKRCQGIEIEVLIADHEKAADPRTFSDTDLDRALDSEGASAWPHLVKGLRLEKIGSVEKAAEEYSIAARQADKDDWQALFKLVAVYADMHDVPQAARCAQEVLQRVPDFPLRKHLEQLIALGATRR